METVNPAIQSCKFEVDGNLVLASWSDELPAESEEFLETVKCLLELIISQNKTRLFLDSGTPAGGSLTEEVVGTVLKMAPSLKLEKIALLESRDFLWDNNLQQVAAFIKETYSLPYEFRIFNARDKAFHWLKDGAAS